MMGVNENPEKNLPSNLDNYQYLRERAIQPMIYKCFSCGGSFPVLEGKFKICKKCMIMYRMAGSAGKTVEQSPMEMVASNFSPIQQIDKQPTFVELVRGTDRCKLADVHREKVKALLIYDPKRKAVVPSRFCSFHLASFDHDEETKVALGPPYESDAANMAGSSINVISLRVVKAGPDYTYPVEVYGRVIARDEVDYKCVFLFDRERKDAQFINSEKDMLALTGPRRALVTDGLMCFEFDLKVKGKGEPDCDVQFSKGVILYRHNFYNKRMISQLPSFQSTVKLVLQHVASPMAASVEVSVVKKQLGDRTVHFNGKITVGTTRNYRQHMVVYDSSLPSGDLVTETGSLVLDRNLLAIPRRIRDNTFKGDEQETIYVCFLGAGSEIEDEDYIRPEEEDEDEDEDEDDEEGGTDEEEIAGEEEDGEDPTNLVALKYPLSERLWEHGSLKLKVKVHWTAIIEAPLHGEFLTRLAVLPEGYKLPDYRWGSVDGSFCQ